MLHSFFYELYIFFNKVKSFLDYNMLFYYTLTFSEIYYVII